jgi:hypothetical protein
VVEVSRHIACGIEQHQAPDAACQQRIERGSLSRVDFFQYGPAPSLVGQV